MKYAFLFLLTLWGQLAYAHGDTAYGEPLNIIHACRSATYEYVTEVTTGECEGTDVPVHVERVGVPADPPDPPE